MPVIGTLPCWKPSSPIWMTLSPTAVVMSVALIGERAAQVILELEAAVGLLRDPLDDLLEHLGRRERRGGHVGVDRPADRALSAQHSGRGDGARGQCGDSLTTCDHVSPLIGKA
jgi:hypothetical protein